VTRVVSAGVDLRYDSAVSMTGAPSTSSGSTPGVSLQTVIDAPRRLDELSTARVIGEAAEAVHKAQKGGQPLGTLMPQAIVVTATGISLAPPPTASVAYTAPERLRGQAGDRRSDVFSLGVVLWEALAHERLFDAATDDARKAAVLEREIQAPSGHNANVPAELDAICKKALDRDPANRYQSAKVMAAEISAVLDDAGYPDSNEQITSYLATAFPGGAASASSTAGASLAAKLASAPASPAPAATTPASRQQLNMTMHGMAPIREPAKTEPAKAEPAKAEPVKAEPAAPIVAAAKPGPSAAKLDASKTMTVGSGLSLADLPKAEPKLDPGKTIPAGSGLSIADLPKAAAEPKPEPASGLSPMAFIKPAAGPSPAPSVLAAPPVEEPPAKAKDGPAVVITQPGTGVPTLPPAEVAKPKAMIVDEPKPKAMIVDEPKPKASISSAETIATPALIPTPALAVTMIEPAAASSGIVGLPAAPPGAFNDDFSTNASAKPYPEAPAPQAPTPNAPVVAAPNVPAVDPSAAVSLPRPRSASQAGADRASAPDMLADWGWKSDSHAAIIDDEGQYEDSPNAGRKRLLYAIGGALGAILLIVVIAVAASGGGKDKDKDKAVEPPIADTSRTAEPRPTESAVNAKMAVPTPVEPTPTEPAPTEPTPTEPIKTLPAYEAAAQPPPTEPTKVEPAPVDTAKVAAVDTAKVEAARVEAARVEAAKVDAAKADAESRKAAKLEAARAEAARIEIAKADAATQKAAKLETARLAKIEAANVAAAKAADTQRLKAEKAEAARIAKAAKLAAAKTAPVETTRVTPPKAPKKDPKKDPKTGKLTGKPVDPYAAVPDKAPKADPSVAYKTGFQQYVRGDTSGALSTFKGSLAANPGYPPTWRGLGLVYEKMGQKAQAKKSFLRYLQLSPKASDADQIRTRMEKLGS